MKLNLEASNAESASPLGISVSDLLAQLRGEIIGQDFVTELALATFLAGGHLLIEGPPGTGKTSLAKKLAATFAGSFRRIQMTSDMLPTDITGVIRLSPSQREFEFRKGPLFSNFVMADELNRTSPKTQSALLEGMAEKTVTADGKTYELPDPFFVIATQNPAESFGVYPLVESQLDRFMMKISMQTIERIDELKIYHKFTSSKDLYSDRCTSDKTKHLMDIEQARYLRTSVLEVFIESSVTDYITEIVRSTRQNSEIVHGVSVRGGIQLILAAKGLAFLRGRKFVLPADVKELAVPVLSHRLIFLNDDGNPQKNKDFILSIVARTRVPQ